MQSWLPLLQNPPRRVPGFFNRTTPSNVRDAMRPPKLNHARHDATLKTRRRVESRPACVLTCRSRYFIPEADTVFGSPPPRFKNNTRISALGKLILMLVGRHFAAPNDVCSCRPSGETSRAIGARFNCPWGPCGLGLQIETARAQRATPQEAANAPNGSKSLVSAKSSVSISRHQLPETFRSLVTARRELPQTANALVTRMRVRRSQQNMTTPSPHVSCQGRFNESRDNACRANDLYNHFCYLKIRFSISFEGTHAKSARPLHNFNRPPRVRE